MNTKATHKMDMCTTTHGASMSEDTPVKGTQLLGSPILQEQQSQMKGRESGEKMQMLSKCLWYLWFLLEITNMHFS